MIGLATHFLVPTSRPDYQKTACGTSSQRGTTVREHVDCLLCRRTKAFRASKPMSQTEGWASVIRKRKV